MIGRFLKIILLLVLFLFLVGAAAYITFTFIVKSEEPVIVPELTGKDVVYALERLTGLELNLKIIKSEHNDHVPKNHILFQEPEPGTEIKKGRDVRIILSRGVGTVVMPHLYGVSIEKGRIVLEENGLEKGVITRSFHPGREAYEIVGHDPVPGAQIEKGTRVNMLVSLGPAPEAYIMPDLMGLSYEKAISALTKRYLKPGDITSLYVKGKDKNSILGQTPLPGYRVEEGDRVDLIVNRRNQSDMPEALGATSMRFVRLRAATGYLNRRVKVVFKTGEYSKEIHNDFIKPGETVWVLLPENEYGRVNIYEFDDLVKTEKVSTW